MYLQVTVSAGCILPVLTSQLIAPWYLSEWATAELAASYVAATQLLCNQYDELSACLSDWELQQGNSRIRTGGNMDGESGENGAERSNGPSEMTTAAAAAIGSDTLGHTRTGGSQVAGGVTGRAPAACDGADDGAGRQQTSGTTRAHARDSPGTTPTGPHPLHQQPHPANCSPPASEHVAVGIDANPGPQPLLPQQATQQPLSAGTPLQQILSAAPSMPGPEMLGSLLPGCAISPPHTPSSHPISPLTPFSVGHTSLGVTCPCQREDHNAHAASDGAAWTGADRNAAGDHALMTWARPGAVAAGQGVLGRASAAIMERAASLVATVGSILRFICTCGCVAARAFVTCLCATACSCSHCRSAAAATIEAPHNSAYANMKHHTHPTVPCLLLARSLKLSVPKPLPLPPSHYQMYSGR